MILILRLQPYKMPIVKINTYRSFPPQLFCRNLVVSLWLILGLLSGCNTSSRNQSIPETDRSPKVVVTNTILCDLTKQIAANTVNIICILAAGSDPHIYQITPTDRKKILFTTHDALGYYGTAYGLPIDALSGLSTDEKPNAARVKELIDKIEKTQVPTIFAEETLNPQVISIIARSAHVNVSSQKIYADGLGEANSPGGTYQKMLISNTKAIVEGLGGKFKPFGA